MAVVQPKVATDLGFLGEEFQFRFVKYLIEEHKYFRDVYSIVDQNAFVSDPNHPSSHLKMIVGVLRDFFEKNDYIPSYDLIEIELRSLGSNEIQILQLVETLERVKTSSTEGQDRIRDLGTKFFKQQNLIKAINLITKITKEGDITKYDACEDIIRKALNVANGGDLGFDVFEGMELALAEDFRCPVPTGASLLDEALNGGLGKGEIGLVIAPSGIGKTSSATAFCSHASTFKHETNQNKGFKVCQIFFEDKPRQVQRKHYGRLTGVEAKDLSKDEYKDIVRDMIKNFPDKEMLKENLRLKKFYNKTVGVNELRNFLRSLINSGFHPDMVVIDYFECLKMNTQERNVGVSEWTVEGETFRALEAMAEEFGVALWVYTQATKDASQVQTLTQTNSSGSKTKYDASHVVVILSRTGQEMQNNIITIQLAKNRNGSAGIRWDGVQMNNGTAIIDMSDVTSFDSNEEYQNKVTELQEKAKADALRQAKKDAKARLEKEEIEAYASMNMDPNVSF